MLDDDLKAQLKAYLERITQPIELVASLDGSDTSREMLALLNAVAAQSTNVVVVEEQDDAARKPSFLIQRVSNRDIGVRFAGLPMGHEFTSLVLALLQVGGYAPKLDDRVVEQIRSLDGDFRFEKLESAELKGFARPVVVYSVSGESKGRAALTQGVG